MTTMPVLPAGRRARIEVSDAPKLVKRMNQRFICDRCRLFCMELIPVLRPGHGLKAARAQLKWHKMYCRNGCHEREGWGFHEFGS